MMMGKETTLVFSDIHADISALKAIFECISSKEFKKRFSNVKKVINLGDVVGRGYAPGKVIEFIENLDIEVVSILGNHDESVMYDWPVPGDDIHASRIHDEFKQKKEHWDYFNELTDSYIDTDKKLLCVHGGPIDPDIISPPGLSTYDKWLYQRTWQRLDPANSYYNPYTGFRYTPDMAFEHGKRFFKEEIGEKEENILIFTGHQHREAVYQKKGERILNIHALIKSRSNSIECPNHVLNFSEFVVEIDSSYLVRFGIAGPIGYNFYTAQFGVLYLDRNSKDTKIALMEVDYSNEAHEVLQEIGHNVYDEVDYSRK